ncbi:uncharacterized protein METZ01_LOCUS433586, partial [marine metagenome]
VQDRELGDKRSLNEMRQDLAKLTSVERDLQDARQSLSEKELQTFNRMLEELPAAIGRRQKSQRWLIMVGCVACAAVAALVFLGISGSMERSDQLRELRKGVDEIQKVTEMQAFLDSFSAKNPGRKEDPVFAVLLKRGRDMMDEETKRWQNLQKKVIGLQRQIERAKKPGQLALLDEERQAVAEDSLKLNASFSKGAEEAIDQLDLQWRIKQDEVRLGVSGQLGAILDYAQLFAETNATLGIPASQLSENLQLLNASLVSLEEKQR